MSTIRLSDLQRAYRSKQNASRRAALRAYLIGGIEPSAAAFRLVSRRLYADGLIDNLGLADIWISTASITERARLFSSICTALLGGSK
jgi:hypothetical protein